MSEAIRHVTARTCPIDAETGKFLSEVAEAAFVEAVHLGVSIDRKTMQQILQAHNAAEDRSRYAYEAHRQREQTKLCPETLDPLRVAMLDFSSRLGDIIQSMRDINTPGTSLKDDLEEIRSDMARRAVLMTS